MGMYTELHYNAGLKKSAPQEVIDLLRRMLNISTEMTGDPPDHALFKTHRWEHMLRMDSYYFSADTQSTLRFDDIAGQYFLCVRCNLKNYDDEIEAFVDWLDPWVDAHNGDFLGFSRYEESEDPELIRKKS